MPFLVWSASSPAQGSSNADYGSLRQFSYSRDIIAVGVPNPPHGLDFHARRLGSRAACLESGVGPRVRIHLSPSEKPEGIRHFWPGFMLAIVPKPSQKIVPKDSNSIWTSARIGLAPVSAGALGLFIIFSRCHRRYTFSPRGKI